VLFVQRERPPGRRQASSVDRAVEGLEQSIIGLERCLGIADTGQRCGCIAEMLVFGLVQVRHLRTDQAQQPAQLFAVLADLVNHLVTVAARRLDTGDGIVDKLVGDATHTDIDGSAISS
jgi:hypothetical protein